MPRYIDADKIIFHLKDEMDYGMGDIDTHPVQYGTYLGLLYAKSLVETAETANVQNIRHLTPCDMCKYNPPSSSDGKPCCLCPASAKIEEE